MPSPSSIRSTSEANIVAFSGKRAIPQEALGAASRSPDLLRRASNVAMQMRYFGLIVERSSFEELLPSAARAGFSMLGEDKGNQEVSFQWALGKPDFVFSVSFKHPASVVAQSLDDFLGLTLTSSSYAAGISVETNHSFGGQELGRNALALRDILLTLPDFDATPGWTKFG